MIVGADAHISDTRRSHFLKANVLTLEETIDYILTSAMVILPRLHSELTFDIISSRRYATKIFVHDFT